ncbi:MAG TPA: ATP-binding cassette domain-containing protein, partial [Solirubrobacteraceae bacterium]|nr:ATP-binding cassette domain-containing protein [Solirubrobacteraceae bacterium]
SSLVVGGAIAGLSGGILVGFINLWDPQAWGYAETVVLFAAVIIGGLGNHKGAVLGALVVPLAFEEATRYIPPVQSDPNLIPALQWVIIGLLIIAFLWFRPQGIIPERRRKIATRQGDPDTAPTVRPTATNGREVTPAIGTGVAPTPNGAAYPAGDVILQCRGLSRRFDGVEVVGDVSIDFQRGYLTGIIGPNGAGKSTVLAMLAGTLPATSGQILYEGDDVTSMPAYRRARAGLVRTFQLASEFKRLTVIENLLAAIPGQRGETFRGAVLGRRYWGRQEREAVQQAEYQLERFGLHDLADRYAGELSGGQRRLVEIMRALMAEPQVLLLDEPMAGVHPRLAHEIGMQLVRLCGQGTTVIMVEHELSIMDEFCDPVVVLAEGHVLAEGTMAALRKREEVVEAYLVG